MENLESCVQTLDMRSMPQFLDQVSESRENEASRHFSISLYAELARVHKEAVIPFIPRMMASIVRSLPFSADSQQLHEACAKVVTSVARYTIDPTRPYDSNQEILFNLCTPLLPVLSSKLESSAAGAAICLQALVESEKWKFAHTDLQDLICAKATAALVEQGIHAVAFLHLLKSLAKFCMDASRKHVAEWLGVVLQVLQVESALWQSRLAAVQLITIILKTADEDISGLDLPHIIKILESCLLDKVTIVQAAVREAFEAARGLALEKHLLCAGRHEYSTPGKTGSIDFSCESRGQVSGAEESSMQDLSNSVSPRSGASSHEAIPIMASSAGNFCVERRRPKQQEKNASYLPHFSGSLTRTSVLKENTPATIPRRVLSELPASGKRFSNSDFLPSSWEGKSFRRASADLGIKAASYSMQNQAPLGSKKYTQHVHAPIHDSAKKTASLVKKHVDGCQNISSIECMCIADVEKKETECISHGNVAAGQNNIVSKNSKTVEELDQRAKDSERVLSGGCVSSRECLHGDIKASESDGDVGCSDDGPLSKDSSMETISEDLHSPEKGSDLKVASSFNPSQDFAFRAPGSLLPSIRVESLAKDMRQSCKDCSDCEDRAPRERFFTSNPFASGDSEKDRIVSVNFQSRNAASCCRSEESDTCTNRPYKLSSRTDRQSIQSTSESACRISSVLANDSEVSASGRDWPSSRDSSDREADYNFKLGHRHTNSKSSEDSGSRRCQAEGHPELITKPGIRSTSEVKRSDKGTGVTWIRKEQVCAGAALGLFCAVGMLMLAIMVIQHADKSKGLHVLVPT